MEPPVGFATDLDGDGAELALGADDESEVDLLAGELMGGDEVELQEIVESVVGEEAAFCGVDFGLQRFYGFDVRKG